MNRAVTVLLLLLIAQCVVTAAVFWPSAATEQGTGDRLPLAPFDPLSIRYISIGDGFDNRAELARVGDVWLLPELDSLPADQNQVERLLAALFAEEQLWPVANSDTARQRFQVADYLFQRRIDLRDERAALGSFFLGTSPGFRRVHARNREQAGIYSIRFNVFDAPTVDAQWLDPNLLQIRAPVLIAADVYSLYLQDGEWLADSGTQPDQAELDRLLVSLRTLQIEGVATEDAQRQLATAESDALLEVTSLAGEVVLELYELEGRYYVYSSEYPLFFRIEEDLYRRLTDIDPQRIAPPISP